MLFRSADDASGDGDNDTDAAPAAERPTLPAMLTWEPAPSSHETPGRDAYSLRLVTGKTLYDHGRTASRSAVLRPAKEKSQPGRPLSGRGKAKRAGSPSRAARSIEGPPG